MAITCKAHGTIHSHETVAEVRACYGQPAVSVDPGRVTGYTTRATGGNKISQGDYPVNPRSGQYGTSLDRVTDKQAKYLKDLLGHARLQPVGWEPEQMTKDSASQAITELKAYLNRTGPLPRVPVAHVGEPVSATPTREPYPDVPAGHYATISDTGNNDLDFWRVDRPTEGRWKGRTFVKRVIGGRPNQSVRGSTALAALKAIVKVGPDVAGRVYGQEIGQCRFCNRHLTRRTPRYNGQGNDCAAHRGLVQIDPPASWRPEIQDED